MKKVSLAICITLFTCALWAQSDQKIIAEGRGKTLPEAVANAKLNAVEAVCGSIIKSHDEIKGDGIKSELRTYTNGFISGYRIVSLYRDETVKIEAVVASRKIKDWVAARTTTVTFGSEPVSLPPQSDFSKRSEAYTRMATALLKDYTLLFHVVPQINSKQVVRHDGKLALAVNYMLVVRPQDYRNYLKHLSANFKRMGVPQVKNFTPPGVGMFKVPGDFDSMTYWKLDPALLDLKIVAKELGELALRIKFEALDDAGDTLSEYEFIVCDRLFGNAATGGSINPRLYDFSVKSWVLLPLLSGDDVDQITMIKASIGTADVFSDIDGLQSVSLKKTFYQR